MTLTQHSPTTSTFAGDDAKKQSSAPSLLSLLCLMISFLYSFWHDLVEVAARVPTIGEVPVPGPFAYHIYTLGWALPLIASVLITMGFTNVRGTMHPAFPTLTSSPALLVQYLKIILVGSNIIAFLLILISRLGMPQYPHSNLLPYSPLMTFRVIVGRSAMPAFYNVGWSLITAVRHPALSPLQSALGLAYEHTIVLHRLLGWLTVFWLSCHSIGYLVVFSIDKSIFHAFIPDTFSGCVQLTGLVAFLVLIIVALFSSPQIRRPRFKIFAYTHWLWVVFLLLSIMHIPTYFLIILPPLFLFFVDRLSCIYGNLSGVTGSKHVVATLVRVSEDAFAVLIPVGPLLSDEQHVLDSDLAQIYTPGRFLRLALAEDPVGVEPMHPFSIASYSMANRTVCLVIRALGPWTRRVHTLATDSGSLVDMRVSGPFSVSGLSYDNSCSSPHTRIIVAGGVGVSKYMGCPSWTNTALIAPSPHMSHSSSKGSVSLTTMNDGTLKGYRAWLCKDPNEYIIYAYIGADLSGWNAFCSKGFLSHESQIPCSFPLAKQTILLPLTKTFRIGLFIFYMAVYIGLNITSHYVFILKIRDLCSVDVSKWIYCCRGYELLTTLHIFVGIPLIVVATSAIFSHLRSITRSESTFTCHTLPPDNMFGKNNHRFNLASDLASKWSSPCPKSKSILYFVPPEKILRSCTGKPLRNSLCELTHNSQVLHVDDGIGL